MSSIALFHSVLGVRPGVHAAADLLRSHGHMVRVVDQYEGRVFDSYDEASAFANDIGYPALMTSAARAVEDMPTAGFVCAGFSNGGGMSQHIAGMNSSVRGVLLLSGVFDPSMMGLTEWPATVAVQIHYSADDQFRNQGWIDSFDVLVRNAGAAVESFDYPGTGHLFSDQSLAGEYDPVSAELLWRRALVFLDRIDH